jgi:hypothetical protein
MDHRLPLAALAAGGSLLAGLLASPAGAAEVEQHVSVQPVVTAPVVDAADTTALEASSCFTRLVATRFPGEPDVHPAGASVVTEQRTATSGPLELAVTAQAWSFTVGSDASAVDAGCLLVDVSYVLADARADEPVTLDLDAFAAQGAARMRVDEWALVRAAEAWRPDGITDATVTRSIAFDPAGGGSLTTGLSAVHGAFTDRDVFEGDSFAVSPVERQAAQRTLLADRLRASSAYAAQVAAADRSWAQARARVSLLTAKERVARALVDSTARALQQAKDRAAEAGTEVTGTQAEVAAAQRQVTELENQARTAAQAASTLTRQEKAARGSRKASVRRTAATYGAQARTQSTRSAGYARSADSWRQRVRELMAELAAWRRALDTRTVEQAQAAHDGAVAAHGRVLAELDEARSAFDAADAVRAAGVDAALATRDAAFAAAQAAYDAAVLVEVTAETSGTARVWVTTTVA